MISQQPSNKENPKTVDIKSDFIENSKASHKLFKTIKQTKIIGCGEYRTTHLNSETKQIKFFK